MSTVCILESACQNHTGDATASVEPIGNSSLEFANPALIAEHSSVCAFSQSFEGPVPCGFTCCFPLTYDAHYAFLIGTARGESYFSSLLAALLLFEVGMLPFPDIEPVTAVLDRPGAADLFAVALERGLQCPADIAGDHQSMLARPLSEVRAELGIPEPEPGPHMFLPETIVSGHR